MKTEGRMKSSDNVSELYVATWTPDEAAMPDGKPVCILQIVHGMSEYVDRYAGFAAYLNGFGVLVTGEDHIGHGHSAKPEDYGYFAHEDGWKYLVDDIEKLHRETAEKWPGIPYIVMGHSMGSFLTRAYLAMYGKDIDGAVIMGTAGTNKALAGGKALTKAVKLFRGERAKSALITAAAFGSYTKRIPDMKTNNDWLSRDDAVVSKYRDDPMCGFTFTLSGYLDLFNVLQYVNDPQWYKHVKKDLPILITAGKEDPVGNYGEGPTEVHSKLLAEGCDRAELDLYEGMRHEILNEFGKEQVYEDVKDFVLACAE